MTTHRLLDTDGHAWPITDHWCTTCGWPLTKITTDHWCTTCGWPLTKITTDQDTHPGCQQDPR